MSYPRAGEWIEMTVADAATMSVALGGVLFRHRNGRVWYTRTGYLSAQIGPYVTLSTRNRQGALLSSKRVQSYCPVEIFVTTAIRQYLSEDTRLKFKVIVPVLFNCLPPTMGRVDPDAS